MPTQWLLLPTADFHLHFSRSSYFVAVIENKLIYVLQDFKKSGTLMFSSHCLLTES